MISARTTIPDRAPVCLLFQDHYPWDVRVEKIARSLSSHGHRTTIVSRNRDGSAVREPLGDNLDVRRLPAGPNGAVRRIINFPAFFSPFWIWSTYSAVAESGARLIIVRDLPLTPTAWLVGRRLGVPVLMDMAEDYPSMIQDTWLYRGPGPIDWVVRNPALLRSLERWALGHLDGFFVVSDASAGRIRAAVGLERAPIWLIQNTPRFKAVEADRGVARAAKLWGQPGGLRLLYTGGLEASRGLATVIRSLPVLVREGRDPVLIIAGEGEQASALRRLAAELGVSTRVRLVGWVDHGDLPALIDGADICLVPHLVTPHTETTLPNKIYDYMARGKPVVVTQARALVDLVERYCCGVTYRDTDPEALARAIHGLVSPELRTTLGESGRRAIRAELSWEHDERRLLDAVASMADARRA